MKFALIYFCRASTLRYWFIVYIYYVFPSKNDPNSHFIEILCCQYNHFSQITSISFSIISISHLVFMKERWLYQPKFISLQICLRITFKKVYIQSISSNCLSDFCRHLCQNDFFIWLLWQRYYLHKIHTTWNVISNLDDIQY